MIDCILTGRLSGTPVSRIAKTGTPFVTAGLVVAQPGAETERLYVSAIAFDGEAMAALLAHERGDSLAVSGRLTIGLYEPQTGAVRPNVNCVVHAVLSPYFIRKKRHKVAAAMAGGEEAAASEVANGRPGELFVDDDL
jgi:Single-strand binding protein family